MDIFLQPEETFEEWPDLRDKFLNRLDLLQRRNIKQVEHSSTCLGCERVGTFQYQFFRAAWEDWTYHYVYEHNGIVSKEFCKFIIESTNNVKFPTSIPLSLVEAKFVGLYNENDPLSVAYCTACDNAAKHKQRASIAHTGLLQVQSKGGRVRGGNYRSYKAQAKHDMATHTNLANEFLTIAKELNKLIEAKQKEKEAKKNSASKSLKRPSKTV